MFDVYPSSIYIISVSIYMIVVVLLSILGLLLVRRVYSHHDLMINNEVAGFTFSVIAVFFALQLGFIMASAQQRFDTLNKTVEAEANILAQLFRDSIVFPNDFKKNVTEQIQIYIQKVVEEELNGEGYSLNAAKAGHNIWQLYYNFTPQNELQKIWYTEAISKLNEFNHLRLDRLYFSKLSLDGMMWTLLIGGACATITFMYIFGMESLRIHMVITGLLAALIAFLIVMVYDFDNPFIGAEKITPAAFENVLKFINS